ncbi:MAG: protein kinase [Chlamydiota bacterium]|nr:protein kinase [Chlamydiota bacterium]
MIFADNYQPCSSTAFVNREVTSKKDTFVNLVKANQEQAEKLELICEYIESHWADLMESDHSDEETLFREIVFDDNTSITVHPAAEEICIFLEGHTKLLGAGAFKKVVKGLTYRSESEVAVAFPRGKELMMYKYLIDDGSDSNSSIHLPVGLDQYEAQILEKVQVCRGVTELFFISYFESSDDKNQSPLIVQKYYNAGTLWDVQFTEGDFELQGIRIYHDLLMALSDIHEVGIVHNDLHSSNILLGKSMTFEGVTEAVIADFGISKELAGLSESDALKYKMNDLKSLDLNIVGVLRFKNSVYSSTLRKIARLLTNHISLKSDVKVVYQDFLNLIEVELSEEQYKWVTQNAMQKRRLKIHNGNTVVWR